MQIVNKYGKDRIVTDVLNAMDIFMEIVSNPDGFAFTHSMVRPPEREGPRRQLWGNGGKVTVVLGRSSLGAGPSGLLAESH